MKLTAETMTEQRRAFDTAWAFTQAYRHHSGVHPAIREARCLREQYPAICAPILERDLVAGRQRLYPPVAFALEYYREIIGDPPKLKAQCGYSFSPRVLDEMRPQLDESDAGKLDDMIAFWEGESTWSKYDALLPDDIRAALSDEVAPLMHGAIRVACMSIDFDTLLLLGIPGLAARIGECRKRAACEQGGGGLYDGMLEALDVLVDVCRHYECEARACADSTDCDERRAQLIGMAEALANIAVAKPGTFREAMQLFWLYNLVTGTQNYGRMDVYLGDFYAADLDSGRTTEAEAQALIESLWMLIADRRDEGHTSAQSNGRVVIGGAGRRNEANADRFALAAIEATCTLRVMEPQLTLRIHGDQDPSLMRRALDVIGEGSLYPMVLNDDANVPWVREAFDVSPEEAQRYLPGGCGEYALGHTSIGSPNCALNLAKALELALHRGRDANTGKRIGLDTGALGAFDTFDRLLDAYKEQVRHAAHVLARRHAAEYKAERESSPFLFVSMLFDDCIERGKALFDGGARYTGGVIETFGLTNASDSLVAIKELVFERKVMSLAALVEILDANFEGFERERQRMLGVAKYGNDDEAADGMLVELSRFVCDATIEQAEVAGLDYYLICNLNPGGYDLGAVTGASADGRRNGEPFAIGNTPTAGRDRKGPTALLSSLAKPEPLHAGYAQNMKFSKRMFGGEQRKKLEALLNAYWARGGTQAMITAVNRGDLEEAMKEPEKHANLMVRVGGFSAEFVTLPRDMQVEIANRTLY